MIKLTTTTLAFLIVLGSQAMAQKPPLHDLPRARQLFSRTDLNHNGSIEPREAFSAGIHMSAFRTYDLDSDGKLTVEEVIVGYKDGVTNGGGRVAPDLENEARLILARRRAEQAEALRRGHREASKNGPAAQRKSARGHRKGVDPAKQEVHRSGASSSKDSKGNAEGHGASRTDHRSRENQPPVERADEVGAERLRRLQRERRRNALKNEKGHESNRSFPERAHSKRHGATNSGQVER